MRVQDAIISSCYFSVNFSLSDAKVKERHMSLFISQVTAASGFRCWKRND